MQDLSASAGIARAGKAMHGVDVILGSMLSCHFLHLHPKFSTIVRDPAKPELTSKRPFELTYIWQDYKQFLPPEQLPCFSQQATQSCSPIHDLSHLPSTRRTWSSSECGEKNKLRLLACSLLALYSASSTSLPRHPTCGSPAPAKRFAASLQHRTTRPFPPRLRNPKADHHPHLPLRPPTRETPAAPPRTATSRPFRKSNSSSSPSSLSQSKPPSTA